MSTRDVDEGLKPHGTVTLIGRGGDAADSARDFLERNGVALRWIDLDHDPLGGMLQDEDLGAASLPLAIFADGTPLEHAYVDSGLREATRGHCAAESAADDDRLVCVLTENHRAGRAYLHVPGDHIKPS